MVSICVGGGGWDLLLIEILHNRKLVAFLVRVVAYPYDRCVDEELVVVLCVGVEEFRNLQHPMSHLITKYSGHSSTRSRLPIL